MSWQRIKLKNSTFLLKDGTHGTHKNVEHGKFLLSAKDVADGKVSTNNNPRIISDDDFSKIHSQYKIQNNDIVLTIVGTLGETAIIKEYNDEFTFQRSVAIIRFDPSIVNYKFGYYQFLSDNFQKELKKRESKGAQGGIYLGELGRIEISCPDLVTQENIVAILEKWDAAIENLKQQILEEEKILKSLCENVFNSGIFAEVKLADIAVLYQPKTIAESELQLSGYPVYGANGLIGYYDKYNHESSQIAITCRGSTCGTVNLVPGFSWITGNAMVVNIDDNEDINQKYLYYFLKNINFKPFISGSGQPQIVKTSLSKMKIKVPDLKEQLRIALILGTQDQKLSLLHQKLSNYEKQRKYLLNRLSSGKEDI